MMEQPKILIIEDGFEYFESFTRFLSGFCFVRAGNGPEALRMLLVEDYSMIFLDMRFDRIKPDLLLGNLEQVADRFNGDLLRSRQYLEDNQGSYILSAIREAGHKHPIIFSYDFASQPRRWTNLEKVFKPLDYLPDNAPPEVISACLTRWVG